MLIQRQFSGNLEISKFSKFRVMMAEQKIQVKFSQFFCPCLANV